MRIVHMIPVENRCPAKKMFRINKLWIFNIKAVVFCDLKQGHDGPHRSQSPEMQWNEAKRRGQAGGDGG